MIASTSPDCREDAFEGFWKGVAERLGISLEEVKEQRLGASQDRAIMLLSRP